MNDKELYNYRHAVGWNLEDARKKKGLSREKMAALYPCDRTKIQRIETGNVGINTDNLFTYSKITGVPTSELARTRDNLSTDMYSILEQMTPKYRQMAIDVLNTIWRNMADELREERRKQADKEAARIQEEMRMKASRMAGFTTPLGKQDWMEHETQRAIEENRKPAPENRFCLLDAESLNIPWEQDRNKVLEFMEYYEDLMERTAKYYDKYDQIVNDQDDNDET